MRRRLLISFLAVLALSVSLGLAADETPKLHSAIRPVPRDRGGWMQRHERMNQRVKQGNVDLVFVGDSITHGWEARGKEVWKRYYAPRAAVNLGIGGDRTQHVLWRLENGNLEGIRPKLAVVMIGTNNSGSNTPEETAEGVGRIVEKLREKSPETKVLVLAIFPRGADNNDARRQVNQKTNALIAKLADGKSILFLDIGEKFLGPGGTLSRDVMPDLLHLTADSYAIWAKAIEPVVSKILGPLPEPATDEAEEGFVSLFDGRSLDGWRKEGGGATYSVEDGTIVGRVGPGANTFLCTKKDYADFILKLELKFDVPVNSGIQVRSHVDKKGRVFGYQCEVDPTNRAYSGGIYDERRRGWLLAPKETGPARKAFKVDGWNEFVIRAVGPRIQTWINGVPCADLTDDKDAKGLIGLQVHKAKEGQIRWRNIRIKEVESKKNEK
ncbi:MAG: DUF1080 domain-containing protein [Pirellulales bacterium]|nr:DUF1080 domain-containing protein [Pirellulales bacterium]